MTAARLAANTTPTPGRATLCRTCDVEWRGPAPCWNCGGPGVRIVDSTSVPWANYHMAPLNRDRDFRV